MPITPWYKTVTPRAEVREGRSFNPDEFAIDLQQVMAGSAPDDYRDPVQFFARTCFTRALREHAGMVLRRLAGKTANTAPVLSLVTQFGGGKTHTLCALYHLATSGDKLGGNDGVRELLAEAGLEQAPAAKVAVFVGSAWDPQENNETPWIDLARQLAGEAGVRALGAAARETPPGTTALERIFAAAGGPALVLFDEVLNFTNRHRAMADSFHAFIQNLTVAMTATTHGAAVISLPRSAVEMTEDDMQWQERITKVVKRVAKDLIANDEGEIGEVVRRRLFDSIGDARTRNKVSKTYADWCFERRAELPPEWLAAGGGGEKKARDSLRERFEACYPFHPATLAVFQRKWQALAQYQRTRGTLAMLAQWIAWAYQDGFNKARKEPLITLGSAPLGSPEFRGVMLGQLGESRLEAAIDTDIAGQHAHARMLDADSKGKLREIYLRVGATILFESSGGQAEKVAHLPELRFALGEPEVDTTSVDNAALMLEEKSYFIRKVGSDGFRISHQPTLKKVASDRRASLDEETEIKPAMRSVAQKEFSDRADVPLVMFPDDGAAIQDLPRLTLVVVSPEVEWDESENAPLRERLLDWTMRRGNAPRLYPGALVWCLKKPGRDLRHKVETMLAWRRVAQEVNDGILGGEFTRDDHAELRLKVGDADDTAKESVWESYRYAVLLDRKQDRNQLEVIDLGAGHSSSSETLCGRVIAALRSRGLLDDSVGRGYLERHWPAVFVPSGAWPLDGLRKSFVDGSLIRLKDPDQTLRQKIIELVGSGEFGLGAGAKNGDYAQLWHAESVHPDEITFDADVFLLTKQTASALRQKPEERTRRDPEPAGDSRPGLFPPETGADAMPGHSPNAPSAKKTIRLTGAVPPEVWNKLGTRVIPKLRAGDNVTADISLSATVDGAAADRFCDELRQILKQLNIADRIKISDA
ncbi:MAG: DUF499 domain-containing protein [Gammaproteobacteria bacterium]|nr:DUF499 domain-containing protein [Gammaproteobacteria bacterium]